MPPAKRSRAKRKASPVRQPRPAAVSRGGGMHATLPMWLLLLASFIAYANAWPNNLVFDDQVFADSARFSGMGLTDLPRFFAEDLWSSAGSQSSLYRPLLMVSIALQSMLFGEWMSGYHLVNIGLHGLATLMVFRLLGQLLRQQGVAAAQARSAAFLAALVFAVHPIHTEVVNSIFNGSELMVCIGVAGGLAWFLRRQPRQPAVAWLGLSVIYLLVLLCRESAASLPALAVALLWLAGPGDWKERVKACLPVLWMLLPLAVYVALRMNALDGGADSLAVPLEGGGKAGSPPLEPAGNQQLSFELSRILPAAVMWLQALKLLLWPHPLQIYYDAPGTPVWLALGVQAVLLAAAIAAWIRGRPGPAAGGLLALAFFYLAILPSSRILGEAATAPVLADRLVYLPSVGLAIALAFGIASLLQRFRLAVVAGLLAGLCVLLTPLSWARNAEWASDIRLFESDYARLDRKNDILNTLIAAHNREGNARRAAEICDENAAVVRSGAAVGAHCGVAYAQLRRYRDAEQAYLRASSHPVSRVHAHFNLALMYLHLNRRAEARQHFELAITAEPQEFMRAYFTAVMLQALHPANTERLLQARQQLEQALRLQPQHVDSRRELDALNQTLERRLR